MFKKMYKIVFDIGKVFNRLEREFIDIIISRKL